MNRFFKFVGLALMLVMGVSPLLASVPPCHTKADSSAQTMSAMPCCRTLMAKAADRSLAIESTSALPPCCRISHAKPARTSTACTVPPVRTQSALQTADPFMGVALPAARTQRSYHIPLPDSVVSTAFLCTFLI